MAQVTTGIRAVLAKPFVYNAFQVFMGGNKDRARFARFYVRAYAGQNVLDIGSGTSEILNFLPNVNYWGYDISQPYINAAKERYGRRGTFTCGLFNDAELDKLPQFDIVMACGLLHHLEDEECLDLFRLAMKALRPGGRFLTNDPAYAEGQNPVARFMVSKDRGQNVRHADEYQNLAKSVFDSVKGVVNHSAWIPYTRYIMECTKG